jgi:hypothetical protein
MLGPAAGGLLYGLAGANLSYLVAAVVVAGALAAGSRLGEVHPPESADEGLWRSLATGVRFVFGHQVILGALVLDMVAVLFGGVVAILPVFAELLRMGPVGLGLLRAAQSAGALTMALVQSRRPAFLHAGKSLFLAVALFGVCILGFAISRNFALSFLLLAAAGMADNVSVVIRASILQAATPDRMRGRVAAVNGIFIGSSNELGAFESGLAARLLGATRSVVLGGVMTLVAVGTVAWKFPRLRKLQGIASLGAAALERDPASSP